MREFNFRIQLRIEFARVGCTIESSGEDHADTCDTMMIMMHGCSSVKITEFLLFMKNIVPFRLFSCIYSILKT